MERGLWVRAARAVERDFKLDVIISQMYTMVACEFTHELTLQTMIFMDASVWMSMPRAQCVALQCPAAQWSNWGCED